MAVQTIQYFKDLFVDGYVITEENYQDWLDTIGSFGAVEGFYEEGEYTPSIASPLTFTSSSCSFVRVGNLVNVRVELRGLSGSGFLRISTPFTISVLGDFNSNGVTTLRNSGFSDVELSKIRFSAVSGFQEIMLTNVDSNIEPSAVFNNSLFVANVTFITNVY